MTGGLARVRSFSEMGRKPCCEKLGLKRGRWTEEEDAKLIKYVEENGEGSWSSLSGNAGLLRCGKSCRLRWTNYLRPNLEKGRFSSEEDDLIVRLHASLGSRRSLIASHLSGRTDNGIKNYWNSHLRRKIHPFWRCKIGDQDRSFPINGAKLDLPPSRLLWKESKTHIRKCTELQVHDCNIDSLCRSRTTTTEVISMVDEVISNPDAGNNEENTERVQEMAMIEKEGEAEEGPAGSDGNIIVTGETTNAESANFNVDEFFDLAAERDETSHGLGGSEERESEDLSFLEMAKKWDCYSDICREEDKILSWLWDDDDDDRETTNKEAEFDSDKLDAMFAWLLS